MRKTIGIERTKVLKVCRFKLEMMYNKGQIVVVMKMIKKKSNNVPSTINVELSSSS
jgi:hypothetical protein